MYQCANDNSLYNKIETTNNTHRIKEIMKVYVEVSFLPVEMYLQQCAASPTRSPAPVVVRSLNCDSKKRVKCSASYPKDIPSDTDERSENIKLFR